jgi:hypothetical protein
LKLKHIKKGKIVLPWDVFLIKKISHLRNGLAAGAFTRAANVCGRNFYWDGQGFRSARECEAYLPDSKRIVKGPAYGLREL